jgi:hypothetical protein
MRNIARCLTAEIKQFYDTGFTLYDLANFMKKGYKSFGIQFDNLFRLRCFSKDNAYLMERDHQYFKELIDYIDTLDVTDDEKENENFYGILDTTINLINYVAI